MLTGVILPRETFELRGQCATGSGFAPAEIYGQTADDRARGFGGGAGVRVSYMYMSRLDPTTGSRAWWGLRLGLGLDLHLVYADTPIGIAPQDGGLCSSLAKTSHPVEHAGRPLAIATIPLHLGGYVGLGSFGGWSWRGAVLGVAWAPASTHVGLFADAGWSRFNYLGFELTLDLVTLHARTPRDRPGAHTRISAFFAPPPDQTHPVVATLGVGATWY